MKRLLCFAFMLPVASLLVAGSILSAFAVHTWWRLQHMPREGSMIVLRNDIYPLEIPREQVPLYVLRSAGYDADIPIIALDFPGDILEILVLGFRDQGAVWYPVSLGVEAWGAITVPFFALPAWWFAGRGFDSLVGARRTGRVAMAFSIILSILTAFLCLLATTCMTQDRQHPWGWLVLGTAAWTPLFSAPAVAWFLQRRRQRRFATEQGEANAPTNGS